MSLLFLLVFLGVFFFLISVLDDMGVNLDRIADALEEDNEEEQDEQKENVKTENSN